MLETEFETADGAVRVIDFMPRRGQGPPRLMRIVEGLRGRVPMRMELCAASGLRVDRAVDRAGAGRGDRHRRARCVPPQHAAAAAVEDGTVRAEFVAVEGARERLTLTWHLSYEEAPPVEDADSALARTEAWWREWSGRSRYQGAYREEVLSSLIVLKAMTSETTGAVIAAPTTSLPEDIGGDPELGLPLLLAARLGAGARSAARRGLHGRGRWRSATSCCASSTGDPTKIQIMYGIGGERRLTEFELAAAPGLRGLQAGPRRQRGVRAVPARRLRRGRGGSCSSAPSCSAGSSRGCGRAGAPPSSTSRRSGASPTTGSGSRAGPRRHYTYSKVMAWVVFDRAVRLAERFELEAPLDRWKQRPRRDPP